MAWITILLPYLCLIGRSILIEDGDSMSVEDHANDLKLPIHKPLIRGYLHHAYQLSVLGMQDRVKPWIFMNFIQLVTDKHNFNYPVQFYMPDEQGYNWGVLSPCFDYQILNRNFVLRYHLKFIDIVRDSIRDGKYVYAYINEKYIPGTWCEENNYNFNHMIMISGINEEVQRAYFWGYDKHRNFTERSIDYEQLQQAYVDNKYDFQRTESRMFLFKIREDPGLNLSFELPPVIEQLIALRESRQMANNFYDFHAQFEFIYGLDVYQRVIHILKSVLDGNGRNIMRSLMIPLHVLMEHKQVMVERLKYIESCYPQLSLDLFITDFNGLSTSFESLRNQILKYEVSENPAIVAQMIDKVQEVQDKEYDLLGKLIETLSTAV